MQSQLTVLKPAEQSAPLSVLGTNVTVLSSANDGVNLSVTRQSGEVGMGPPPHAHDWDEVFYVMQGSVDFHTEEETIPCEAGSLVIVPAGTVHGFSYGADGGEMLEVTGNGSNAVSMFTDLDQQLSPSPLDIPKVVEILGNHGVSLHK